MGRPRYPFCFERDFVIGAVNDLFGIPSNETSAESGGTPQIEPQTSSIDGQDGSISKLLELTIADVDEIRRQLSDDPFLFRFYSSFHDPRKWDPSKIVASLEEEFATDLDALERNVLKLEIEAFRYSSDSLYGMYRSGLNQAASDRLLGEGEYDVIDENGRFPAETQSEVFATDSIGSYQLLWERDKYPELYRLNMIHQKIPVLMLMAARHFILERSFR